MPNIFRTKIILKVVYRLNAIHIKIAAHFFLVEIDKLTLKFMWKYKRPRIAKTIMKKKSKVGELTLPISKLTTKYSNLDSVVLVV